MPADSKKHHVEQEGEPLHLIPPSNPLDFKSAQIDDLVSEKLEEAFHKPGFQIVLHDIVKIASEYDSVDLAHAVTRLPPNARIVVYDNLPDLNSKVIFMINTGNHTRSAIFKQVEDGEIIRLIEGMPPDEAVWVLDDISDRRLKRILDGLDAKKAARIKELQQHERHSAGRMMTNEFFAFPMATTVGEVASQMRNNPGIELTGRIFVLTDEGELAGYVPERNLIVNPHYLPIRQAMQPILQKVTADTSRDEVVDLVERYNIPALPVVDESDRLIGVIAYEDAVEAMKDIADETIANIAGTAEDYGEHEQLFKRFMWRAPWLVVTLCAGLFTATVMSNFSDRLWFLFIPFFVPLIAGMSGNVGIQCSSILVRGMSTGAISPGTRRQVIVKELLIGLIIGLFFGIFCGLLVYFINAFWLPHLNLDPFAMGVTISFGVLSACLVATFLGTFSPFFFAKFRIDPAVASGPIVTAFNDVLSTLMFFLVARTVYLFIG